MSSLKRVKALIQTVPDFPEKGILFRDITPLLADSELSRYVLDLLVSTMKDHKIDAVAGIESRGFLFGMSLAHQLGVGFIPVRKKGKLPRQTVSAAYKLEYGAAELEIHKDVLTVGKRIHIHDDLLATGGTAAAVAGLITEHGPEIASFSFIIELSELAGRKKITTFSNNIEALVVY